MKMLNNIVIGLLILLGIGLMTQGNQWGSACIVVSIFIVCFYSINANKLNIVRKKGKLIS